MAEEPTIKITQVGDNGIAIGNLTLNFTTREGAIGATYDISQLLEDLGVSLVVPVEPKAAATVSSQARAVAEQIAIQLKEAGKRFGGPVGDPEVYLRLGAIAYESKNYNQALQYYDDALAINPQYADAWNNRGNSLSWLGRHQEALASCDKAIALNPNLAHAWNIRGNSLSWLGRHEEALASCDKAIALNPNLADAWRNRGYSLNELGREREAQESFRKAEELRKQQR